jgi:hypothetical protein
MSKPQASPAAIAPLFRRRRAYVALAAGLVCLVWGAVEMWRGMSSRKRLELVDARIRISEPVRFGAADKQRYRTQVEVNFTAEGQRYTIPLSVPEVAFSTEELNDQLRRFSPGTALRILYDPLNPEDVQFEAGESNVYLLRPLTLLGCGLLCLSAVFVMIARDGRYHCAVCGTGVGDLHACCFMCGKKIPARKGKMAA